jgi:hypothetical protein
MAAQGAGRSKGQSCFAWLLPLTSPSLRLENTDYLRSTALRKYNVFIDGNSINGSRANNDTSELFPTIIFKNRLLLTPAIVLTPEYVPIVPSRSGRFISNAYFHCLVFTVSEEHIS